MQVPVECRSWEAMLATGKDEYHAAILRHIVADPCIDQRVAATFFALVGRLPPPTRPDEALLQAYNIVRDNALTCTGRAVPTGILERLIRIESIRSLLYRVPEACGARGITLRDLDGDLSDDDLISLTDEYDGEVVLGNLLGIVWVTDREHLSAELHVNDFLRRAGVVAEPMSNGYVLCTYDRESLSEGLFVPRALDAIDQPRFAPTQDCTAPCGRTLPLSGQADEGLPEAIHRGCRVTPTAWKLVRG